MTVENEKLSIAYTATGSVADFAYDFLVYQQSHLVITLDDVAVTEGWSISGLGEPAGGTITFDVNPTGALVITRDVPLTQLMDYTAYDAFPAESHETALDLLAMGLLQVDAKASGLPPAEGAPSFVLFNVLADAIAATTIENDDTITIAERLAGEGGGSQWKAYLATEEIANDMDIVASTGNPLLVLKLLAKDYVNIDSLIGVDKSTLDVSTMINRAYVSAEENDSIVIGSGGVYRISNSIIALQSCNLENCQFEWDGGDSRAIVVATGTANSLYTVDPVPAADNPADYLIGKDIKLGKLINLDHVVAGGWAGEGIGISCGVMYNNDFSYVEISGFTQGLLFAPSNAGNVYNKIRHGTIVDCKESFVEAPLDDAWTNQNLFESGRFYIRSAESPSEGIIAGTVIHKQIDANHPINNNVYLNPSYEGNFDDITIDTSGTQNKWISPRIEPGSIRNAQLARDDSQVRFNANTVADSTTYSFTLAPVGGGDEVVSIDSGIGATVESIALDLQVALQANATLSALMDSDIRSDGVDDRYLVIFSTTSAGFTYVSETSNLTLDLRRYQVGTGDDVAKKIVFRNKAKHNRIEQTASCFLDLPDTQSLDSTGKIENLDTASNNFVGGASVEYHDRGITNGRGFKRYRNSSSLAPTHVWYGIDDDPIDNTDKFVVSLGADGFNSYNDADDTIPSVTVKDNRFQLNHPDGVNLDIPFTMQMLREEATYSGGRVVASGLYDETAAWDGAKLDKDNFNGILWQRPVWNGAIHFYDGLRVFLDSENNLRHNVGANPTKVDDGYIANRPIFDGGLSASNFTIGDGQALRFDATGGQRDITMPTDPNEKTSVFFLRDESEGTTTTYGNLLYNGVDLIMGQAADYLLNAPNQTFECTFVGGTRGWHVTLA